MKKHVCPSSQIVLHSAHKYPFDCDLSNRTNSFYTRKSFMFISVLRNCCEQVDNAFYNMVFNSFQSEHEYQLDNTLAYFSLCCLFPWVKTDLNSSRFSHTTCSVLENNQMCETIKILWKNKWTVNVSIFNTWAYWKWWRDDRDQQVYFEIVFTHNKNYIKATLRI